MNNKFLLSFVLGIFVLSVVSASISGMAISVKGDSAKQFSFQNNDYSVGVQKQADGTANLEINGQTFQGVKQGDIVVVDGASFTIQNVKKPLFSNEYKVDMEVKEENSVFSEESCALNCGIGGHPECAVSIETGTSYCNCVNVNPIPSNEVCHLECGAGNSPSCIVNQNTGYSICNCGGSNPIPNEINATSCNADAVCEIEKVSANKGDFTSLLSVLGMLSVENANGSAEARFDSIQLNDGGNIYNINHLEANKGDFTSLLSVLGMLNVENANGSAEARVDQLKINSLAIQNSSANAYVCVNSGGQLYRSSTPCI